MTDETTKIIQQQDANMKESEDEDESKKIVNEKDEQEDSNTVQKFKQALFSSI